jgi:hypothetical protein
MFSFAAVDSDFESMGYSFANDNRNPVSKLIHGCREMWAAVLEEAFRSADLAGWVGTRDFSLVCEYAGVEPDVMRVAASRILKGEAQVAPRIGRNKHVGARQ